MEGITRRIDELGRIVVPKEIRKALRLSEGSVLEFSLEDGQMVLKKFSPLSLVAEVAEALCKTLSARWGVKVSINDGYDEEYGQIDFTSRFQHEEHLDGGVALITPVVCCGDILGNFILLARQKVTDEQLHYCAFAAEVLSAYATQ